MTYSRSTMERFGSLAVLLVLLMAAAALAAAPFYKWTELQHEYQKNEASLAALNKDLVREAVLRKENEKLIAAGQDTSLLLEGETTGIAGANLQSLMNSLVLENHGKPTTSQILAPKEEGDLIRISMSMSLTVDTDGLRDVLHSIETQSPLIFIDDLSVSSGTAEVWSRPDPHLMGPLEVTLQVSAFVSKNKASQS